MFIRLTHLTRYEYSQPVTFSPHALYLRPRETSRQRLHHFALTISPTARRIATTDALDNALDWAYFAADLAATTLEFSSELLVETLDHNPFDFFLKPSAIAFPFSYDRAELAALSPCLAVQRESAPALQAWLAERLPRPPTETVPFLLALNTAVHGALLYGRRDEEGIQSVEETLRCGRGSCRDFAAFLIELLRTAGVAARFVSGYLYEPPAPTASLPTAMHAWAEAYLPGAGWRGLDATRGIFCDDAFVPVAHAAIPASISPVQGTFLGPSGVRSTLSTRLTVETC